MSLEGYGYLRNPAEPLGETFPKLKETDGDYRVAVVHKAGTTITKDFNTYEQALSMYDANVSALFRSLLEWRDTGRGKNWVRRLSMAA